MPGDTLERLAAELVAVAEQMRRECRKGEERSTPAASSPALTSDRGRVEALHRWQALAERLYHFRRRRDRLFGPIFGEPAWDILLDLLVMEAGGVRVPVSSACIASGASHSTALRQIDELVRHGLVERIRDEHDRRRTYIRLSDRGLHKLALSLEQFGDETGLRMTSVNAAPA